MTGWVDARRARLLDLRSQGDSIVTWASLGLVASRARAVRNPRGHAGYDRDADGWFYLPAQFWEDMQTLPGSEYRRWSNGTFIVLRGVHAQAEAHLVEFRQSDLDLALGIVSAPLTPADEKQERTSLLSVGRPSAKRRAVELFLGRLAREVTLQSRAAEARSIRDEWESSNPPSDETIKGHIKGVHDRCCWAGGRVTNRADVEREAHLENGV